MVEREASETYPAGKLLGMECVSGVCGARVKLSDNCDSLLHMPLSVRSQGEKEGRLVREVAWLVG